MFLLLMAMSAVMAVFITSKQREKRIALAVIAFVYVLSNVTYSLDWFYYPAIDMLGVYVYGSLFELLAVGLLALIPCSMSFAIMIIALLAVITNAMGFVLEALGINPFIIINTAMWSLWALQLLIIINKDIENGFIRCITANGVFSRYHSYYRLHSSRDKS